MDGHPLRRRPVPVWLALHKPAGVTSTVADRHAASTVLDLRARRTSGEPRRASTPWAAWTRIRRACCCSPTTATGRSACSIRATRWSASTPSACVVPLEPDAGGAAHRGRRARRGAGHRCPACGPPPGVEIERMEALAGSLPPAPLVVPGRAHAGLAPPAAADVRGGRRAGGAPGPGAHRHAAPRRARAAAQLRALTAAERDRLVAGAPAGRDGTRRDRRRVRRRRRRSGRRAPQRASVVVVSIDGPGSSGKSQRGRRGGRRGRVSLLRYRACCTGVSPGWPRSATWTSTDGQRRSSALVPELHLAPDEAGRLARVIVDGRDVTGRLHAARVDRLVSAVAADPGVRAALLPVQRDLAAGGGIVMAGRDIGTRRAAGRGPAAVAGRIAGGPRRATGPPARRGSGRARRVRPSSRTSAAGTASTAAGRPHPCASRTVPSSSTPMSSPSIAPWPW